MTGRFVPAATLLSLFLLAPSLFAACGTPTAPPSPSVVAPLASLVPPSPAATAAVSETPSPASPGSSTAAGVTRDDSLLAILPPAIDGVPVAAEEASFAEAAADPEFADHVAKAAFAIVAAPNDLASGVVAQLDAGVYDDTFFRDWRETYNEGVCAQAGGVVGNAEAELDGRTVYIATCDGGLRVYHTYLEERGALVSLFSLGEGRYGERLMADLRP